MSSIRNFQFTIAPLGTSKGNVTVSWSFVIFKQVMQWQTSLHSRRWIW